MGTSAGRSNWDSASASALRAVVLLRLLGSHTRTDVMIPVAVTSFVGFGLSAERDECGEESVDANGVREAQGVGDADGVFVAVAELMGVETVLVPGHDRAGDVEHVVHRGGAGADERLEAVDDAPFEQVEQAVVGRTHGRVAELDDLLNVDKKEVGQRSPLYGRTGHAGNTDLFNAGRECGVQP